MEEERRGRKGIREGQSLVPGDRNGKRERKRGEKKEDCGQGSHFRREHSGYAQETLLVAVDEDVACQNLKGRPVQMSEH